MHCSLELFWLMRGYAVFDALTYAPNLRERMEKEVMCGAEIDSGGTNAVWGRFWHYYPGPHVRGAWYAHEEDVTCPDCLVAMDAALERP